MRDRLFFLALLIGVVTWQPGFAQLSVETATTKAYNSPINGVSFQQDALVSYKGYQYLVYWSQNRHVTVARRALPKGPWESVELADYQFQTSDAHYTISLGISPEDGRLHLAFDQWSSDFRYRKSVPGVANHPQSVTWSVQLFGSVQNTLTGPILTPTTYPRFVTSPSGKLLLLLRHGVSGSGDSFLYEYSGHTGRWSAPGKLIDGLATDVSAYFNGIHYDSNGRLHATWTWRETPNASSNHDLHYMYSDDEGRNWYNNAGRYIGTPGCRPVSENTPGTRVWTIAENRGLINQESQTVDSRGRVSILASHLRDSAPDTADFREARLRSYVFHYLRETNGQWSRRELPGSSFSYDRNKIVADAGDNLFAVINRDGIYRASAAGNWNDWQLLHPLTDQSLFAEVQIDRQRLMDDGVLSFVTPATPGRMTLFDYRYQGEASGGVGGGPSGYSFCAEENGSCRFSGQRDVAFGAGGRFFHRQATGEVTCNTATFGEPVRGSVKRCYMSGIVTVVPGNPVGYEYCAEENQQCSFSGIRHIAYGTQGRFHYRIAENGIACTNSEFKDPYRQTVKNCYVSGASFDNAMR